MATQSRGDLTAVPGLTFRVHAGGTAIGAAMAAIGNAANAVDGIDERTTAEEIEAWLDHPTPAFDPSADLLLAEVDGALVGAGWVESVETSDGVREMRLGGYVHPDWQRRGIGRSLLARQEDHARRHPDVAAALAAGMPVVYGSFTPDQRVQKRHLLERAGFAPVRYFATMRRLNLDVVEVPPMPDGIEIRPIGHDRASQKQLWDADIEAFADHWGGFDASEAAFERELASPDRDPSLFVVAWDGDQIAGAVVNTIYRAENEALGTQRGWLDTVFVRRPWRRRGLGAAIVARSLVRLREAGMSEALLGVDGDNPTGAFGLYERAGFAVYQRSTAYRKPMEEAP